MAYILGKYLFSRKGIFIAPVVLVFGILNILPVSSQGVTDFANTEFLPTNDQEVTEACHWQADVTLFASLFSNQEKAQQMEVPCEQKVSLHEEGEKGSLGVSDTELGATIHELTVGYPIEVMIPAIVKYDREVAGLIVGIAKKESNWGKRSPSDAYGNDCFNYWGYKGGGSRGVAMGHGCFGSPEEAVAAIGDRLKYLVSLRETSEPKNMIVWKCGASCQGHSSESVKKWIADVDIYYRRIAKK